eukprot:3221149-Rhodomonas_salina.2
MITCLGASCRPAPGRRASRRKGSSTCPARAPPATPARTPGAQKRTKQYHASVTWHKLYHRRQYYWHKVYQRVSTRANSY